MRSVPDELLTRKELAAELKISLPTLDKLRKTGLRYITWGRGGIRFRRSDVVDFLARHSKGGP